MLCSDFVLSITYLCILGTCITDSSHPSPSLILLARLNVNVCLLLVQLTMKLHRDTSYMSKKSTPLLKRLVLA